MTDIKITEVYLWHDGPRQGAALVDGTKVVWEYEDCSLDQHYNCWTLSEDEWKLVDTQPDGEPGFEALCRLHGELQRRKVFRTFFDGEVEWSCSKLLLKRKGDDMVWFPHDHKEQDDPFRVTVSVPENLACLLEIHRPGDQLSDLHSVQVPRDKLHAWAKEVVEMTKPKG